MSICCYTPRQRCAQNPDIKRKSKGKKGEKSNAKGEKTSPECFN